MGNDDVGEFLDLLYAAAIDSPLWVPAMERLADMLGGTSSWLSRVSAVDGSGSGIIARIDPAMPKVYSDYFAQSNPFAVRRNPERYIRDWQPRIRFFEDFLPRELVAHSEFCQEFQRPQNIRQSMMIGLAADGIETCVLNVNTADIGFDAKAIAVARRLHPHLRRAFDLSRRFAGAGQDVDLLGVLDNGRDAVFLVDAIGRVRHANLRAQRLVAVGTGLRLIDGCLVPADATAAAGLARLIGTATARNVVNPGGGVAIPRIGAPPLATTVTPLRRGAPGVFADAPLAIVCVRDPVMTTRVSADRLRAVYGFTPAETRVALALLDGNSPRAAAAALGVSFNTVRNQIQSLYDKTATRRQSELVLLLARDESPLKS